MKLKKVEIRRQAVTESIAMIDDAMFRVEQTDMNRTKAIGAAISNLEVIAASGVHPTITGWYATLNDTQMMAFYSEVHKAVCLRFARHRTGSGLVTLQT